MKEILMDYIVTCQLQIDRSLYFSVILGQITIYGALLTFLQFVVSFQSKNSKITTYLGINLKEYYLKKNLSINHAVVSTPVFWILFLAEVLYKPFISIWGNCFDERTRCAMNFMWHALVILYFVIFIILSYQFTRGIISLKNVTDIKTNEEMIRKINQKALKRTIWKRIKCENFYFLKSDMEAVRCGIKEDRNPDLYGYYCELIGGMFEAYCIEKKRQIRILERKHRIIKDQIDWEYNSKQECKLFYAILQEQYFCVKQELLYDLFCDHLWLINMNMVRAEMAGVKTIEQDRRLELTYDNTSGYQYSDWFDLTLEFYKKADLKNKRKMIHVLHEKTKKQKGFLQEYCKNCVREILEEAVDVAFENPKKQKKFVKVYENLIWDEEINERYSEKIKYYLIENVKEDCLPMIRMLNKKNCAYLFAYVVLYYWIYEFRTTWHYINVIIMRELWKDKNILRVYAEVTVPRIEKSNIGHRFSKNMYISLADAMDARLNGEFLDLYKTRDCCNIFYVTVMKLCAADQKYESYVNEGSVEGKVQFVNQLARHPEVLRCDRVQYALASMSIACFRTLQDIPKNMDLTLRCFLLTYINVEVVKKLCPVDKTVYRYEVPVGEYLLIRASDLTSADLMDPHIKYAVRRAFELKNMTKEQYLSELEKECNLCGHALYYTQKKKMEDLLSYMLLDENDLPKD